MPNRALGVMSTEPVTTRPLSKAAVTKALQEFIARREQRRVAELFGKLEWDDSYDYKAERSRRA